MGNPTQLVDERGHLTAPWQKRFAQFFGFDAKPLPNHANNAAALAAGLKVGDFYRNGDNLCVVH